MALGDAMMRAGLAEQRRAERLLPCPFCGGTDTDDNACQTAKVATRAFQSAIGKTAYQVECGCGARGPADLVWVKANEAWNKRTAFSSTERPPTEIVEGSQS